MKTTKTACITGASSGIGLESAKIYAAHGYNLVLSARSVDKLEKLAEEIRNTYHVDVTVIPADLSEVGAAQKLAGEIDTYHSIDVLVNNAGFWDFGYFNDVSMEKQIEMINLNVLSLTYLTKFFLKGMVARGSGHICNLASTASFQPGPMMAVYYATKAYVLYFSEALAEELIGTGVTVTALCPGGTESNFQSTANLQNSKLVQGQKRPSAREVAEYGYMATMQGKMVAIHGVQNWILAQLHRFLPRAWVLKIVHSMSKTV